MSHDILNVAYIGNGKSTNRYHMPFVQALPDKFRVKTILARHIDHSVWAAVPGVHYTTDLDALLSDPTIDVVEVTTPSAAHYDMAKRVLEAGKHCTVDKPFAATVDQAEDLFACAEQHGVTVQCYQNRRFDSDFVTAKNVVASGKLGHIFEVVTTYDYWRPTLGKAAPYDLLNSAAYGHSSHCLDQLISWFGIPDRWHAEARQLQGETTTNDYFDFDLYYDALGLKATAAANYSMAYLRPSFAVYGDRGAFIKQEKDQQERDLKHFYLPSGHPDFGVEGPEAYGRMRYLVDEDDDQGEVVTVRTTFRHGAFREEVVETVRSCYTQWYDALYETLTDGTPQLVRPEETIAQLRILEDAMRELH